jgi:hypothetical protein
MKNHPLLLLLLLLVLTACGSAGSSTTAGNDAPTSSAGPTAVPSMPPAASTAERSFAVTVRKNGADFATYTMSGDRHGCLVLDGPMVMIELPSPDMAHLLVVDIRGATAGTYPLPAQYEPANPGEATLTFTPDVLPILIPAQGDVTLETLTDESCSGSFRGSGTAIDGATFAIEGRFSNLIVRKVE